jgi:predicted Rossmann-fold nucleotide-binding protein
MDTKVETRLKLRTPKTSKPFAPETVRTLAQQFADYRLKGCPTGGGEALMQAVRQVAKQHERSYGELWAIVHAEGYRIFNEPH